MGISRRAFEISKKLVLVVGFLVLALPAAYNFANPAQVTALREVLEEIPLFEYWGVARPYDKIPEGQGALAAWGRLHFTSVAYPEEIDVFFRSLAGILGPEHVTC